LKDCKENDLERKGKGEQKMSRFRQAVKGKRQSSEEQLKKVIRGKDFLHQCPNCKNFFPSNHESFGRSMGSHMKICKCIQSQSGVGEKNESGNEELEEWEDIEIEMDGSNDFIVDFDLKSMDSVEKVELESMGEKLRGELFAPNVLPEAGMGFQIEELFEEGDFERESYSSTSSEEDQLVSGGRSREFCGAHLVEVQTSDLDVRPSNWRPNLMSKPVRKKGEKFSKDEFLREEDDRCRARGEVDVEAGTMKPSRKFLRYQERVRAEYLPSSLGEPGGRKDPGPFKDFNKVDGEGKDFRDIILLNRFMNKVGMSEEEGDDLLELIFDIVGNHKWVWPMYRSSRRLRNLCEKKMTQLHTVRILSWALPRNLFAGGRETELGRRAAIGLLMSHRVEPWLLTLLAQIPTKFKQSKAEPVS
jgi:hypothetical protein